MLTIDIKPSRKFIVLIWLFTLGSEVIIAFLPLSMWIKIFLSWTCFWYGARIFWRQGLLRHPHSIVGLAQPNENWLVQKRSDLFEDAIFKLLGSSTVTTYVAILRFESQLNPMIKRECVIFPDAVGKKGYHQLLLRVRS